MKGETAEVVRMPDKKPQEIIDEIISTAQQAGGNLTPDQYAALQHASAQRIRDAIGDAADRICVADEAERLGIAREALSRWCGSYQRLGAIIFLRVSGLSLRDTLTLLGEVWSECDNVSTHADDLDELLFEAGCPADVMMSEPERAALAALPVHVKVYRGADRGVNEQGLCWSLDRDVAKRFPFLMRYRAAQPVLVTATVRRNHITAVKLDRDEAEVITRRARIISVRPLPPMEGSA